LANPPILRNYSFPFTLYPSRLMPINLILLYTRENRYSMNALLGAMESRGLESVKVHFAANGKEMIKAASLSGKDSRTLAAVSFFTEQKEKIKKLAKDLRGAAKNLILVAGGPHASASPQEVLDYGFDYAVAGEGEKAFPALLCDIASGKRPSGRILRTREKINLDDYLSYSKKYLRFGPIEITRGCPYACKFCQTSFLFGAGVRHRSVSRVVDQVREMAKLGLDDIRFLSPDALAYGSPDGRKTEIKAVEELLSSVKKSLNPNGRIFFGTFPSEIRPENITEENLNLLKKYAHNRQITIGVQSGSDRLLNLIHRGHGIREIENAVAICLKNGFKPILDFIFGLPGETAEDIAATIHFMEKFSGLGAVIHTHSFTPLPGTPFEKETLGEIPSGLRLKIKHLENKKLAFGKWEKNSNQ